MHRQNTNPWRVATQQSTISPWGSVRSDDELGLAIAVPRNVDVSLIAEQPDELTLELYYDEPESAKEVFVQPDRSQREQLFWPARGEKLFSSIQDEVKRHPPRIPAAAADSPEPTWTVSVPQIEQASTTFLAKFGRTPTDAEMAQRLHLTLLHYHKALMLVRVLKSEISLSGPFCEKASSDTESLLGGGGIDCAIFCCTEIELLKLFRNAVKMLPRHERLVIVLSLSEDLDEIKLSLRLEIGQSMLTQLSDLVFIGVSGRRYGSSESDYFSLCGMRPTSTQYVNDTTHERAEANIHISASQSGCARATRWRETFCGDVTYSFFAQVWILLDEDGELTLVKRKEHYDIALDECMWEGDS